MKNCILYNFSMVLFAVGLLCCNNSANAQNFEWVSAVQGQDQKSVSGVVTDALGNSYIAGGFSGTNVDFDPGPGVVNLTPGGYDTYVLKLDAMGNFVWVKQFTAANLSTGAEISGIVTDALGNVYVTGSFGSFDVDPGIMDFDPDAGVTNLTNGGSMYTFDVFVVKLNTNGALEWARQMGGAENDQSTCIGLDDNGNVLVAGHFTTTADFDPGIGVDNLTAISGNGDVFMAKLDNNGDYVWGKHIGGTEPTRVKSITADAAGNVYTMGTFQATVDFDPNAGTQNLVTTLSPLGWSIQNMFISKLDANGDYVMATKIGEPQNINSQWINPTAMTVDAWGNIYATGQFSDTVDFDPGAGTANLVTAATGTGDAFIAKYNTAGDYVWAKSFGGFSEEVGWRVETDGHGDVYTVGKFASPVDFDPSDTSLFEIIPATPQGAIFLSKLDSTGNFVWAKSIDAGSGSLAASTIFLSLASADSSICISSDFNGTVDFDPGTGTANITALNGDVFVVKLANCSPISVNMNIAACDSISINGVSYLLTGNYTQNFVSAHGCDSTLSINLTLSAMPIAAVTQNGETLNATATVASYQWVDCGNNHSSVAGATSQNFTATVSGQYAVVVSNGNCSDTSTCYNVTVTGIKNVATYLNSVYPNPATDKVTITTNRNIQNATIKLINMLGQAVDEWNDLSGSSFYLDLSEYAPATYMLEVDAEHEVSRIKVQKL